MKEVILKSGNVLKIGDTPFEVSKGLFQAVVKSMKTVELDKSVNTLEGFVGGLLGSQLSDAEIEKNLWACMSRCTYGKKDGPHPHIVPALFEPLEARADFIDVCLEVGRENLAPFMNGLYLALPRLIEMIGSIQASK